MTLSLQCTDLSSESSKWEKKKSHFSYKPFLGEQDQKGLRSFWKGWLHMENNAHQCD